MTLQFNPFFATFLLASILTSGVLVYAVRHRQVKGALYFAFLIISVTAWAFSQALEYAVVEATWKILFAKFQYFGISTIGATWYLFSLSYNRKNNWLGKNYFLLFILPVLTIIVAFTNEAHDLLWPKILPVSNLPGASLVYSHGPAFWVIFIYDYILLGLGTITIIRTAISSKEIYRWQMIGLITSAVIPWIGNFIYVSGFSPIPELDLTPLGFVLSAIIIGWSIFFLRLFDLVPIARDQLVENLIDGVIVLDSHNRVADINLQARKLLAIQNKSAIGHNIVDFLSSWPELVERFIEINDIQTEIHVGSGEITDLDIRISPLVDAQKHPAGRIVTLRDISQQKKLERMRENLVQAVIHDLRNPLTSMVIALEMLRKQVTGVLPREQCDIIDTSQKSAHQMLELVNSILEMNQLENGEIPLQRKRTSLYNIAAEAAKTISILANKKRLLLQLDLPRGTQDVFVDPELMRRVFQNLLDNSIKFSMEGGVIRVFAKFEPANDAFVISVSDTGSGIDATVRENLFEKFASGKGSSSGSGLGLAFCRLVVEAHGGQIWVNDDYQDGTKISLTIPNYFPNQ